MNAKVLAEPAGPYVAAVDLVITNVRGDPTVYLAAGDPVTFEEGDIVDIESLLAIGALLAPELAEGAAPTDEALTEAVQAASAEAVKAEAERQLNRSRREARASRIAAGEEE